MSKLTGFLLRLRRAFNRRDHERQMAAEMRAHLECETARRVAAGEDPTTARHRAALEFGHLDSHKERVRDRRLGHALELICRDARFAWRQMRKSPGFTAIAIATIAIGIGAGTAVLSLVNAILLRSLPVPNPQELRVLHWSGTDVRMRSVNQDYSETMGPRQYLESVNHPTFAQLRERAGTMAEVFGFYPLDNITAVTRGNAISADGMMVSDNFFSGLQVRAFLGRVFAAGDDPAGQPNVVIAHEIWRQHFGADPAVLGRTVTMQGVNYTVIGVLPPGFRGIRPGESPGFYLPMSEGSPFLYVPLAEDWHWFIRLMARLHPGHSDAQLASALSATLVVSAGDRATDPRVEVKPGEGGLGFDRAAYARPLLIMLGVTGLVMFVACANLAGLSLARGAARNREFSVRAALGAGRRRLIAQSLTESALLAVLGGSLGLLLAVWGRQTISVLLAGDAEGLRYDVALDQKVLAFGLTAIVATALVSGLLPAWRAGRVDPGEQLKPRTGPGARSLRTGKVLVAAQIALSLAVLAGAGLGLRTLLNLRATETGFRSDNVIVFDVNPGAAGMRGPELTRYYDRLQEALTAIPGVTDAALLDFALFSGKASRGGFLLTHGPELGFRDRWTNRLTVNESFFATMRVPIIEGRAFTAADSLDAPKVIVVNEAFVRAHMNDRSPIGEVMTMWQAEWRIVGVCGDVKLRDLKEPAPPTTYFPFRQRFYDGFLDNAMELTSFVVRSPLPLAALRPAISQAVTAVDPRVPATAFTTQTALLNHAMGRERLLGHLCTALAGMTLLLCCIGMYGLIAYDVVRRRGELAIRLALGAQNGDVARPILREATGLAAIGVGIGLPVALVAAHLLRSQLYGVSPLDPLTIVGVIIIVFTVALLAAGLPAWRATRIDPITALRKE